MRRAWLLFTLVLTNCGYVIAHNVRGIRDVDFKNQTFPFTAHTHIPDLPRRVRVRNGVYHSPHQEPSMTYTYFKVAEIVVGSLTGDGREEAAVVAIYGGATSDYYETSVYVYTIRGHRARLIAVLNETSVRRQYERFPHGPRSFLFEAVAGATRIAHERLIVRHFAGGAHCCPPNVFTVQYRLNNRKLLVESRSLGRKRASDDRLRHSWEDR